jgi:hypothetical protein
MKFPHRLPRFSLLNALMLMTIVGLSLGLWQNGQKIVPLRQEIGRLRQEIGVLPLGDRLRVHIRNEKSAAAHVWRLNRCHRRRH